MKEHKKNSRFILYILSLFCMLLLLGIFLLFLFGVISPSGTQSDRALSHHLQNAVSQIQHDTDDLAAHAVSFSEEITAVIEEELNRQGIGFDGLRNNPEALASLQEATYSSVYNQLQLTPCSGAFYILNTTCNDRLSDNYRSCLYLRFANLYAESTLNSRVCLYRGAASAARMNNVNLHSRWHLEADISTVTEISDLSGTDAGQISEKYFATSLYSMPESWETARFVCAPLYSSDGDVIGLCGFEISSLYFQLSHQVVDHENPYLIYGLFDQTENGYIGQLSGNQSGYIPNSNEPMTAESQKYGVIFRNSSSDFAAKTQDIRLGSHTCTVASLIPLSQYQKQVRSDRLKITGFLAIITIAAFAACMWLNRRCVAPLLKNQEQIRSEYENTLNSLLPERQTAQSEKEELQNKYELAKEKYNAAQTELTRLAYSRKQEIDPHDYERFLEGIKTLTLTERRIFNDYLDGKTGREILAIAGIKESTLRYHNQNIYSKLGVNSLKQLLRYAAVMRQDTMPTTSHPASRK